jgi:hypothetical protein
MASLFAHASKYSNQRSGSYPFLYDSSEDACLSEEEERIVSAIARVEEGASKPSHRRTKSKYRRPKKKKSTLRTNDVQPQNPYNINADIEKGISEARYPEKDLSINDPVFHLTETRANQSNWSKEPFTTKQMPRSTIASEVSERPKPVPRPLTTMRLQRQANHVSYPPNRTPKASSSTTPWIRNFLSERPKDILLPIPKEYVSDNFNLAQLAPIVERIGFQVLGADAVRIAKQLSGHSYPIYRLALQLILNETEDESLVLQHPLIPPQAIQEAAQALYLMVHARFCQSPRGLDAIRRIVSTGIYGKCPRISCRGSFLLPYGCSNDFTGAQSSSLCQRYCPNCEGKTSRVVCATLPSFDFSKITLNSLTTQNFLIISNAQRFGIVGNQKLMVALLVPRFASFSY